MKYVGKVYAKIAGKYIECTDTVNDLENKIDNLSAMYKDSIAFIGELQDRLKYNEIEIKKLRATIKDISGIHR